MENLPVPFDRRVWMEARTLRDAGFQVSVICPKGPGFEGRKEVLDGITIYRHPLPIEANGALGYLAEYASSLFWEFVLAVRIALGRGFDVIHGCNPPDLIFLVAMIFKLFGKKYVFDHHDLNPELYEAKFHRRDAFHGLLRAAERLTFAAADVSIATNESYKEIAIRRGRMPAADVFVVRSGPEQARWIPGQGAAHWRNGRKHLVGYVGVMGEQEGLDLLIEAAGTIVKALGRDDVQFVLIGDGTERAKLEAQVTAAGLGGHVRFTGRIADAELKEALNSADVLVNPDRPNELNSKSTMNKIVEYMALAKPIVQFEMEEGRFSAQDASVYAKPGDVEDFAAKILDLIDDPEKAAAMGRVGRRRFESALSWEHQQPTLLAAYARVLGRAEGFVLQDPPGATAVQAADGER